MKVPAFVAMHHRYGGDFCRCKLGQTAEVHCWKKPAALLRSCEHIVRKLTKELLCPLIRAEINDVAHTWAYAWYTCATSRQGVAAN